MGTDNFKNFKDYITGGEAIEEKIEEKIVVDADGEVISDDILDPFILINDELNLKISIYDTVDQAMKKILHPLNKDSLEKVRDILSTEYNSTASNIKNNNKLVEEQLKTYEKNLKNILDQLPPKKEEGSDINNESTKKSDKKTNTVTVVDLDKIKDNLGKYISALEKKINTCSKWKINSDPVMGTLRSRLKSGKKCYKKSWTKLNQI